MSVEALPAKQKFKNKKAIKYGLTMGVYILPLGSEDTKTLTDLGLTRLQARVYLALVKNQKIKASLLAKISEVPRPDIYRTLEQLQDMGLVEKEITSPIKYNAISPDIVIPMLMDQRTQKNYEIGRRSLKLLDKLKNQKSIQINKESTFVFVPSKESLMNRLEKAIDSSEYCIDILTSCRRLTLACYHLLDSLQNAWDRGVKGRALINIEEPHQLEEIRKSWRPPNAAIKFLNSVPKTVMAKYDDKQVFFFIKPQAEFKESPALWSNAHSIIALADDYFNLLWKKANHKPNDVI
jgi:sugar-specific transcriptional regulator TrmB